MLNFTANERDGGVFGSACNTCCCEALNMQPGETNLMTINYAPWSVAIGELMAGLDQTIEVDDSACATNEINGFIAPTNTNYELVTVDEVTPLAIDLSTNATPVGNTFTYKILGLYGPTRGTLTQVGVANDPTFTYTPSGVAGYDYFVYEMTDAQNRVVTRTVRISVGTHNDTPNNARMSLVPFVDLAKVKVNTRLHTVSFPITMPVSCRQCEAFKLTLRQAARDCEGNVYQHISCYDIRCKSC